MEKKILNRKLLKNNQFYGTAIMEAIRWKLNVDIAALQETRLADEWSIQERQYTFFYEGK